MMAYPAPKATARIATPTMRTFMMPENHKMNITECNLNFRNRQNTVISLSYHFK